MPTSKVAGEFMELLARLRVDEPFTEEFAEILRQEWNKNAGDSAIVVRKLSADMKELREAQQKLLLKYVKDDALIMPYFESMNRKLEGDIATLEARIAEVAMVEATFAELLEFSKSMLVDIPTRADAYKRT
jgi:hypothetical protein